MKITCESCQAKYTIADEKVVGKIVKIKCKKCGTTIVVNGNEAAAQAAPSFGGDAGHARHPEQEPETRVYGQDAGPQSGPIDEWTVNVTDDDQRTMTAAQVAQEYNSGLVNGDTYVWRDGMPDWLPLAEVPELMRMIGGPTSARPPMSAPTPSPSPFGLGQQSAGAMFGSARVATPQPQPTAARRAGGRAGGIDVFGAAAEQAAAPPSQPQPDRAVGERNENSVLFSLSALTAAENAAKAQTTNKSEDAFIDMRPGPAAPPRNNGRAGFDDIMNLGGGGLGGGIGGPMLAPPPLLAPIVEPPPPPRPPPSAVSAAPMSSPMMMAIPAPPRKSNMGLIVGIVLGLGVAGAAAAFLLRTPEVPTTPEATPVANTVPTAAPSPTETAAASPTDTGATAATSAPSSTATAAAAPRDKPGAPVPGKPEPKTTPSAEAKSDPEPKPKTEPKPAETAAPAGDGSREFNRGAASAALGGAAGAAKSCKKPDGPTGSGKVKVTFAPSGNVTSASVVGGPFAGTSVGGCVASAFRSAKVPPFDGSPVSVTKSFSIN